ncbi:MULTISPECIES: hypothetical protein [unclassified Pseudomonas]|uniref:hypothetical protein n=1 Tax=unclassified Pseudomonas TaxID=196821 RepID=UPI0035C13158
MKINCELLSYKRQEKQGRLRFLRATLKYLAAVVDGTDEPVFAGKPAPTAIAHIAL